MKSSHKTILIGGAALIGVYWLLSQSRKGAQGGSLADQAYDGTIGQVFGAPSRNGSMGTSGWLGDFWGTFWGGLNGLTNGYFNNDIIQRPSGANYNAASLPQAASLPSPSAPTPSLSSYTGAYLPASNTYVSPQGYRMSVAPQNVGRVASQFVGGSPYTQSPQQRAYSILTAPTPQAKTAAGLGLPVSAINPNVNNIGAKKRVSTSVPGVYL